MHTRLSLAADFRALGLSAGQTVLVHAAMRPVGPIHVPVAAPAPGHARSAAGGGRPPAWRAPAWARSAQASLHQGFRSWFRPPAAAAAPAAGATSSTASGAPAAPPRGTRTATGTTTTAGTGTGTWNATGTATRPGTTTALAPAPARRAGRVRPAPPWPSAPNGTRDEDAEAVLRALRDVLGPEGTVVVPAFTESNSATSRAHLEATARMTPEEADRYRAAMPAFDPALTPCEYVGRLAETVRTTPGALRSGHPQTSFAALGARAADIVGRHAATDHLGERSPLAALYEAGAVVVLVGVGFGVCTAFHLAEYRIPDTPLRDYSCVVTREHASLNTGFDADTGIGGCDGLDGTDENSRNAAHWITYRDIVLDDSDFPLIGAAYERSGAPVRHGRVGDAPSRCLSLRDAVDFAVDWLSENRRREPDRM